MAIIIEATAKPYSGRAAGSSAALFFYLLLSFVFWARRGDILNEYLGGSTDALQFVWFLNWWPFAIGHHLNPFITHYVWYPQGANLTWATSVPTAALASFPITALVSPLLSYNIMILTAPAISAWAAFLLGRYLTEDWLAAALGGYVFGFSSYELGHVLGHLNLDTVFLLPLAVLLCLKRFNGQIDRGAFIAFLSIMLVAQLGLSSEILATFCLFGGMSWAVLFAFAPRHDHCKFIRLALDIALTTPVVCVLAAPFLYYLWDGLPKLPPGMIAQVDYSADLLNYIVPTIITGIGSGWLALMRVHFTGNAAENGAYLGIPLILLLVLFFAPNIRNRYVMALLILLLLFVVFSFGPQLHIGGKLAGYTMPWALTAKIPVLKVALPVRFTLYVSLIGSIVVALYVSSAKNRYLRVSLAALACLFIAPNPAPGIYWWAHWPEHSFFTAKSIHATLGDHPNVIIVPSGGSGLEMAYQLNAGMTFTQSIGYVGVPPYPEWQFESADDIAKNKISPNFAAGLKRLCATHSVSFLLVTQQTSPILRTTILGLGWPSFVRDDILVIKPPLAPHVPAGYAGIVGSGVVPTEPDTIARSTAR